MSNVVGAVGVDFGSVATCIAVAKRGGVEVLANEGSHRETPNIIGFGQSQRFIGEQGASQVRENIKIKSQSSFLLKILVFLLYLLFLIIYFFFLFKQSLNPISKTLLTFSRDFLM